MFWPPNGICVLLYQGGGAGGAGLGGAGGAGTAGGSGGANEQLNIQNLQSILQNMGFSAQEQVRFRFVNYKLFCAQSNALLLAFISWWRDACGRYCCTLVELLCVVFPSLLT